MLVVGVLLVSAFAVVAVGGIVGFRGGGYTGEFWARTLDAKLDHLHGHRSHWWLLSVAEVIALILMTAGIVGLTTLLAGAGEPVTAHVALGAYLVALIAWTIGLIFQTATLPVAAMQRAESGATPPWIHAVWASGYLAEGIWVIVTNLAYAVFGIAILASGLLAPWTGWVGIGLGIGIPLYVLISRNGFPELTQMIPLVWGIAMILAS